MAAAKQQVTAEAVERVAFTYKETAQAVGISAAMVRKLVALGQIRVTKIGRAARISRSEMLRLAGEKIE